jgi:beta-ureidopropionase
MKTNSISRRNFLKKSTITAGMAAVAPIGFAAASAEAVQSGKKSNREVWIACISQMGLVAETPEQMADQVYKIMNEVVTYKPDFVVLPEYFPYVPNTMTIQQKVAVSDKNLVEMAKFSKQNNCYTLSAAYVHENGENYNSVVVFDRNGKRIGQYHKIHATVGEIKNRGIAPGPLFQPVIETEYGPIGIQICYDINFDDGWQMMRKQGAKIIFWSSAFDGGKMVNTRAWQHKCFVASATLKNTSRLCDISGETIAQTGIWNPNYFVAPINMEKVFFTTYMYLDHFKKIEAKYGRKVRFTTYHEEEWTIMESLSPDLSVNDIMKEFGMLSHEDSHNEARIFQDSVRRKA